MVLSRAKLKRKRKEEVAVLFAPGASPTNASTSALTFLPLVAGLSSPHASISALKFPEAGEDGKKRKKKKMKVENDAVGIATTTVKNGMRKEKQKKRREDAADRTVRSSGTSTVGSEAARDISEKGEATANGAAETEQPLGDRKEKKKKKKSGSVVAVTTVTNGARGKEVEGSTKKKRRKEALIEASAPLGQIPLSTSGTSLPLLDVIKDVNFETDEATTNGASETEQPVVEILVAGKQESSAAVTERPMSVREKKGKKKKESRDRWGAKIPNDIKEENHAETRVVKEIQVTDCSSTELYDPRKVFVGGMPYHSTEEDIHDYFSACGVISELDCMTFADTGNFRGIAFITFKTEEGAARALEYDGADMGGRFLKIEKCKLKPGQSAKNPQRGEVEKTEGCTSVYIGNLSWDVTEDAIKDFFKQSYPHSKIDSIRLSFDKDSGEFKGFGHVEFGDDESLEAAVKLNQKVLLGRPMKIAYSVPPKQQFRDGGINSGKIDDKSDRRKVGSCYKCGEQGHKSFFCPKKKL